MALQNLLTLHGYKIVLSGKLFSGHIHAVAQDGHFINGTYQDSYDTWTARIAHVNKMRAESLRLRGTEFPMGNATLKALQEEAEYFKMNDM